MYSTDKKEKNTTKQMQCNNKYDLSLLNKFISIEDKKQEEKEKLKNKGAKFTFMGRKTKFITKLLKIPTSKSPSKEKRPLVNFWPEIKIIIIIIKLINKAYIN